MVEVESELILPEVPESQRQLPVAAWSEEVAIDTYDVGAPDDYPAYLDRRVYQGSSGRVYPLPFFERVQSHKSPHSWKAVHLENRYVRLMVLPELGGRIHVGLDKTRDYDFFYRNNVIKPALVGVTGPWLSGGVEFNWPQHHRPATYLPLSWTIEEEPDGSRTVWCSDLDPFARMQGMHGIRLRPDSSLIELRVRLFNRSEDVQTFLWWANVAARVGDEYQSFFPTDVHFVADHAKRAITSFPDARGSYYGVDYLARVDDAHPDANRLDWYRNIPVPTSYMCLGSADDFFGGYDHGRQAGFVHWADHRVSPGKKQWTWGNAPFGWAWDRNLTDGDGPYVELMAGVYTDNQPDFSFLAPGETKAFSQFWYPIQDIGPAHQATRDGAVTLRVQGDVASFGFVPTRPMTVTASLVDADGQVLWTNSAETAPGSPLLAEVRVPFGTAVTSLTVVIGTPDAEVLRWNPRTAPEDVTLPHPADEPPEPTEVSTVEELYLIGLHLEQYRHATRSPEPYWLEALRRDPEDSRSNIALAARHYRDGLLDQARQRLETAVARLTRRNPNPYDGEAHYRLGLVLVAQGDLGRADDCFAKASWSAAWKVPAELGLARIAARRGDWAAVHERARVVLGLDHGQRQAVAMSVIALRHLGRATDASQVLDAALAEFKIDWWLSDLAGARIAADAATGIDIALEYANLGLTDEALRVLEDARERELHHPVEGIGRQLPLILLHLANLRRQRGELDEALTLIAEAETADRRTCFPGRLSDALMLDAVRAIAPHSVAAAVLHGHWLYSRGRVDDAIRAWQLGVDDPVAQRNLGVASFNHLHDGAAAASCYQRAQTLAPRDARLWYERDQLAKQLAEPLAQRLERLEPISDLVRTRDDLSVEYASLLVGEGRATEAVALLSERAFQPWEGGEGQVLDVWERAHCALAEDALARGEAESALAAIDAALRPPQSLGEDRHPLASLSHLDLAMGDALVAAGRTAEANAAWERAAAAHGDFVAMATTPFSERSISSAVALQRLGRVDEAAELARRISAWATAQRELPARIDYFATSLPTLLLFHSDINQRQRITCDVLRAQAAAVLGDTDTAKTLSAAVLVRDPAEPFAARVGRSFSR